MIRFKPAGEWLKDPRLAAKVRRLVDEDRVDFAPFDGQPVAMAYRARVRSTSGMIHDVYFDHEGGACSCIAAGTGHLCSHLAAAMIRFAEMTGYDGPERRSAPRAPTSERVRTPAGAYQEQQARASRKYGHE